MVSEILAQEEVLVLFVLIRPEVKVVFLCTASDGDGFGGAVFLGGHSRHHQVAELQLRFHAEEALTTRNQRAVERKGNITKLYKLQNIILFACIFQLDLVHVVVQGQLVSGVVEIELDLVTDFGNEVKLYILIEEELRGTTLFYREGRIVNLGIFEAEFQLHITGRTYVNGIATKDAFENIATYMQFGDESPTLSVAACIAAAVLMPIVIDTLFQVVIDVLVDIHIGSRSVRGITRHVLEVIGVGIGIIFNNRAHSRRVMQGEWAGK